MDYTKIPLGCLPPKLDYRNYRLARLGIKIPDVIPQEYPGGKTSTDWAKAVPPTAPYDQGTTSMCVAFSGAAGKAISEYRERGAWEDYSVGQIYGWREADHYQGEGMYIEEAAQCLRLRGVAPRALLPNMGKFVDLYATCAPPETRSLLQRTGMPQKVTSYAFPQTREEIQTAIMLTGWAWVSIPVYNNFYVGGHLPMPSGAYKGGHAVVCIGWYNDPILGFRWIYLNSWGKAWGLLKGFFTTPEHYPINQAIVLTDYAPADSTIRLQIGKKSYHWAGKDYPMDIAPVLIDSDTPGYARTMVPLRAIGEITGYAVDWIPATNEIILTPP